MNVELPRRSSQEKERNNEDDGGQYQAHRDSIIEGAIGECLIVYVHGGRVVLRKCDEDSQHARFIENLKGADHVEDEQEKNGVCAT
jgi:hypothetical protein